MAALYRAWRFLQDRVVGYVAALALLAVTILAIAEIFRRYVLGETFHWGQDAVTYVMVSAAFLYFGASQAERSHLAVTIVPDWLRHRGGRRLALAIRAAAGSLGLLFIAGFVYWGLPGAARSLRIGRLTESMIIPLWPFQYMLILGMAIMGVTLLFQIYRDVMLLLDRDPFPWEPEHEEMEL